MSPPPSDTAAPRRIEHFVSDEPFDPYSVEQLTPEQERYYLASQWQLMWWKLKRHRVAMFSGIVLLIMYGSILISELLSPYNLHTQHTDYIYAPPQSLHLFHEGAFVGPFVYGWSYRLNMENLQREYTEDTSQVYPVRFFCLGDEYEFWGVIPGRFHFVCPPEDGTLFLLGTDRLGRDMFSRIISGSRISLTVGLIGIFISFSLGLVIGGAAGYYGGTVDIIIQRVIEIFRSFPEIPLWMALSAILPVTWSPDSDLLRHHRDSGAARLDRARARGALQAARLARGGLLHRGAAHGGQAEPNHRAPPHAGVPEPPDRLCDVVHPDHDPG